MTEMHVEIIGGKMLPAARVKTITEQVMYRTLRSVVMQTHAEVLRRMERHRRTGHAMRSVTHVVIKEMGAVLGIVGSNLFYVKYLEGGTGLYGPRNRWIVPIRASRLVFPEPGNPGFTLAGRQRVRGGQGDPRARFVFARRVRGIRPLRFFRDSALVMHRKAMKEFQASGQVLARELQIAAAK